MSEPPQPATDASPAVDHARWESLARAALVAEGAPVGAEVNVMFVDEAEIAELNGEHLGGDGPTDVLSFPLDFAGGVDAPSTDGGPPMAGDIVICATVAARNAADHAGTFDDEVALLVVHGALHLLGHDHADPGERVAMQARERALLDELYGPMARDPWVET